MILCYLKFKNSVIKQKVTLMLLQGKKVENLAGKDFEAENKEKK
jgi:hypothetical protein